MNTYTGKCLVFIWRHVDYGEALPEATETEHENYERAEQYAQYMEQKGFGACVIQQSKEEFYKPIPEEEGW